MYANTLISGALGATVQETNDFMDTVLHERMQKYPELDPMNARGRYVKLGNFIRSDWTADIDNVKVVGLSRVNRSGDCAEAKTLPSGRVSVLCSLLLDHLVVQFTSRQRYLGGRPDVFSVTATFPPTLASLHSEVGARRYPDVKLTVRSKLEPTLSYTNLGNLTENRPMKVGYTYASSDTLHRKLQKDYVDYLADAMVGVPVPYANKL
ncbi:hypothetical protein HPB52_011687 [Rhipicephalus sanguineus]|uniref:Uncharacterized protein n=1 Tax=Rhipicephalus sanguineus TaxID=34632 RepID=A0A9D4T9L8_RHISA|nr:hypothetical protein HPB52_011687 [Rhipicephalus sanguineus]